MAHGIVLGDDGQKMSKSRRNYPDVGEVFDRDGSDAMRWFLMARRSCAAPTWSSPRPGSGRASGRRCCRCGTPGTSWRCTPARRRPDRVGSACAHRLHRRARPLRAGQDRGAGRRGHRRRWTSTTSPAPARPCGGYLEVLTNWYIRRSRQRFWDGDADAIDTLHTVLETVCRVAAPLLPLTAETVWRGLTGGRSRAPDRLAVDPTSCPATPRWSRRWTEVREVASTALVGAQGGRPAGPAAAGVADRVDGGCRCAATVLGVACGRGQRRGGRPSTDLAEDDDRVRRRLSVNARAAGPRLGKDVQQVIKAAKSGDWWLTDDGVVTCGGHVLADGEYTLELVAAGRRLGRGGGAVGRRVRLAGHRAVRRAGRPTGWSTTCSG